MYNTIYYLQLLLLIDLVNIEPVSLIKAESEIYKGGGGSGLSERMIGKV